MVLMKQTKTRKNKEIAYEKDLCVYDSNMGQWSNERQTSRRSKLETRNTTKKRNRKGADVQ